MSASELIKVVVFAAFWAIMAFLLCEAPPEERPKMLPAAFSMEVKNDIRQNK
ncbi:MAG TPA: hypothetical protein PKZ83_17680 [bacterium]|nr:hypothetical protein [bacterium]